MKDVFIRTPYNYDADEVSRETGFRAPADEVVRTQQHFKEEVDVNTIARRFGLTNTDRIPISPDVFRDFTGVGHFQDLANQLAQAGEAFDRLPSDVRRRFDNNPAAFVDFAVDAKNIDQMREWGLAVPKPVVTSPEKVEIADKS